MINTKYTFISEIFKTNKIEKNMSTNKSRLTTFSKMLILFMFLSFLASMCSCGDYSNGKRAGKLVKFSKKGRLPMCKSWEGSLQMGETNGPLFNFSVEKSDTASRRKLNELYLQDVLITYREMQFTVEMNCSRESNYIVTNVEAASIKNK